MTFYGLYETDTVPYTGYVDAPHERKAKAFFVRWQKQLHKKDLPFKLLEVGPRHDPLRAKVKALRTH